VNDEGGAQALARSLAASRLGLPVDVETSVREVDWPENDALIVRDLAKFYKSHSGQTRVFSGINFEVGRGERLAILGRNGQGKSTLIRILGGVLLPSEGEIIRGISLSWPIGFQGAFQGTLTGLDNIRFIARIYQRRYKDVLAFVQDFSELGAKLREPVKHYSDGMRARLAFGLSVAIDFDCYLIDELLSVGDARFQQKCHDALLNRNHPAGLVLASHDAGFIKEYCNKALVLHNGRARLMNDVSFALDLHHALAPPPQV